MISDKAREHLRRVNELNKCRNNERLSNEIYADGEWLYSKYVNENMTMREMATLSGCCDGTILIWLRNYGIPTRVCGHYGPYKNPKINHIRIDSMNMEILSGLLLGDGSISKSKRNTCACYEHGDKHLGFIEWLKYKLDGIGFVCGNIYYMNVKNGAYKFRTHYYGELLELYNVFYPYGKKVLPHNIHATPNIIKYWYIGDGNCSITPLIDSCIFSAEDMERISRELIYIGIENTIRQYSLPQGNMRKRIRISARSREKFFDYILSSEKEIPPMYEYKFPTGDSC